MDEQLLAQYVYAQGMAREFLETKLKEKAEGQGSLWSEIESAEARRAELKSELEEAEASRAAWLRKLKDLKHDQSEQRALSRRLEESLMEALESNAIGRGKNEGTEIYLREVRMLSENYEERLALEERVTATLEARLDMERAELNSLVSAENQEAEAEEELQARIQNLAREEAEMADALALVSERMRTGFLPAGLDSE